MQKLQKMWAQSLSWEDALEEEMATHSNILAREIPWTEEPAGLQSVRSQRVGPDPLGWYLCRLTSVLLDKEWWGGGLPLRMYVLQK